MDNFEFFKEIHILTLSNWVSALYFLKGLHILYDKVHINLVITNALIWNFLIKIIINLTASNFYRKDSFFFFFLVLPVYCYQPTSLHPPAHMFSHVIPWTSARQTPLSMDFSRQEYWSGLPFPSPYRKDSYTTDT